MQKIIYLLVIMLSVCRLSSAQQNRTQMLTIKYTPTNAVVMIDDVLVDSENGMLQQMLSVGEHSYKVMAQGYYQQSGTVGLRPDIPGKLVVELQPKEENCVKQDKAGNMAVQRSTKKVQKTTKVRVLPKKELTIRDIIDFPGGILECDGDKWTMTQSMLHEALNINKIKCTHNQFVNTEHWIKTKNLKRTYRGHNMCVIFECTEQGMNNYFVGVQNVGNEELESMKKIFLQDMAEIGIQLIQEDPANAKGSYMRLARAMLGDSVEPEMYVAEDDVSRYELCVIRISYWGNHHMCLLTVLPRK